MKNKLSVVIFFLFIIINVGYGRKVNKLIGGISLLYEKYYFVASVQWMDVHVCSGTIINEYNIITTASCVTIEKNIIYSNLKVLTGTFNQNNFGKYGGISDVEHVIIHDKYAPLQFWANDISILKLADPLIFSLYRSPVQLNRKQDSRYRIPIMIGWENFLDGIKLVEMRVTLQYEIDCHISNESFNFHPSQYCYATNIHESSKTTSGDSGNPIVTVKQKHLFGIVSLIPFDSIHDYFILTNVPFYYDWIQATI